MIYKCNNAVLDLRENNKSCAFYVAGRLLFIGSSTIAMKYFVDHCEFDLDKKTLKDFRNRLNQRNVSAASIPR